jgi:dTDP-4-dehydrorhamnose reductase
MKSDRVITVALTGASGLLGRPLMSLLESDSRFRVRGAAFSRAGGSLDRVDITRAAAVDAWLDEVKPDVLVHLAAERRPDVYAENPAAADRLNIDATEALALSCAAREVSLLFLSTNYVFDGTSPPYHPEDEPNPLNDYGKGKLKAERAVLAASSRHRSLRVPMFHGPSDSLEESSVTVLLKPFLEGEGPVMLDVYQTRYPTWAPDIAVGIAGMLPLLADGSLPGPALHFSAGEPFTKRDMGAIMAALAGADPLRAVADDRPPSGALRPKNAKLACPEMEALGLLKITPFREAITQTLDSIRQAGG